MSNLDLRPVPTVLGGRGSVPGGPVHDVLPGRTVVLGGSDQVRRLLPTLGRRTVGAWCFVDHYGPDDIASGTGMQVPPHPHTGLQTVSWLLEGAINHRDSVGSVQTLVPGRLGLMTAGRAIAHSEQSTDDHARLLHGVQLWVALPDQHRRVEPHFEHHAELPVLTAPGLRATVIMGELDGAASPGKAYSPLVGAELLLASDAEVRLPLEPDFEYAVLTMDGSPEVDGVRLEPGALLYLGSNRSELGLRGDSDSRLMLLGGEPFEEQLVMWWNFVARSQQEIEEARREWMEGSAFGEVHGYDGSRLLAPELPTTPLKPRGRAR